VGMYHTYEAYSQSRSLACGKELVIWRRALLVKVVGGRWSMIGDQPLHLTGQWRVRSQGLGCSF
jgi:hypothetical protein